MQKKNNTGRTRKKPERENLYVEKIVCLFSLGVFKNNLAMINRHNHEADMGLHSYTLKMNQFGDMVY